jgi:hypothetical protein
LVVGQPWPAITELFSEHAAFLAPILNSAQLALLHPARQGDQQEEERVPQL